MNVMNLESIMKELEEAQEDALHDRDPDVYFLIGVIIDEIKNKKSVTISTKEIREKYRKEVYENEDQESRFDNLASMFFILLSLLDKLEEV